jgi:hypothetical protein
MTADDPVTVYTVNDPYKAEVVKTALQGQGISCQLDGERQAGLSEILEIGLLVRARDADRAWRMIQRNEAKRQQCRGVGNLKRYVERSGRHSGYVTQETNGLSSGD